MKETTFTALYVRQHIIQKTENINCPSFVESHYPHLLIHVPSTFWTHLSCSSSEPPSGQLKHNKTHGCPSVRPCLFFSLCPIHHFISLCFQGTSIPKSVHVKVSLQCLLKSVWIHWMHYNEARRAFKPEQEHVEHATTYNYLMVTQLCYFPPHDEQQGFKHLLKFMMAKNDINNHQYWYF